MKFSLVVGTFGRSEELKKLFDSLRAQTHKNFHLVIVDQNPDDRVERVIASAGQGLDIRHVRSVRGLSRARNAGLKFADGDFVAFPDDNCWYPPDLLERVGNVFEANPSVGGLSGRCIDAKGEDWCLFDGQTGTIEKLNLFRRATATAIFLRKATIQDVGPFDPKLGVGAESPHQSAEEMDYLLRAMEKGYVLLYDPSLFDFQESTPDSGSIGWGRARSYGSGLGYVLRKHRYPFWFVLYVVARAAGGIVLSLARCDFGRARFYYNSCIGRMSGWLARE